MARQVATDWPLPDEFAEKMIVDSAERERSMNKITLADTIEKNLSKLSPQERNKYRKLSFKLLQCLRIRLGTNFTMQGPIYSRNPNSRAVELWKFEDTTTARQGHDGPVYEGYTIVHNVQGDIHSFIIRTMAPQAEQEQRFENFKQLLEQCLKDQTEFKTEIGRKVSVRTSGKVVPMLERVIPQLPSDVLRAKVAKFVGGPSKIGGRKSRRIRRRKRTTRRRF